jgi:hypothetical protein
MASTSLHTAPASGAAARNSLRLAHYFLQKAVLSIHSPRRPGLAVTELLFNFHGQFPDRRGPGRPPRNGRRPLLTGWRLFGGFGVAFITEDRMKPGTGQNPVVEAFLGDIAIDDSTVIGLVAAKFQGGIIGMRA